MSQLTWLSKIKSAFVENEQIFENVRTFVNLEIAVQFVIFITFETLDKTYSKI